MDKAVWRKVSRSHDDGDQCVEVASFAKVVAIRDSKDPNGPKLMLSRQSFQRFACDLKNAQGDSDAEVRE
ncbi:DUF397 domain-containing protein [Actinomadura sp. SCN-SB]|uniref:DUF397 domain-containing protein n=1 Tax=Actinomadura sp. SCN-SB TaxID=3373092 RepID=UPI0037539101